VWGPRRIETRFLYREIFLDGVYGGHEAARAGCVVDVGANIGLFGLWASRHLEPARLLLFEPIPEIFRVLEANASDHFPFAQRFNLGLASESGIATLRYYPGAAGWASILPREELLRESLLVWLQRGSLGLPVAVFQLLGSIAPRLQRAVHDLVCDRVFAARRDIDCPVTTLSEVIVDHEIDTIDLLKLDVEGAELQVLQGLRSEHWPRLGAVAAEVEDVDGSLDTIRQLLETHGLYTQTRQPAELAGTPFHLLNAVREEPTRFRTGNR
jgi:FkbM family methyltransferase